MKDMFVLSLVFVLFMSGCISDTSDSQKTDMQEDVMDQHQRTMQGGVDNTPSNSGGGYVDVSPMKAKQLIESKDDLIVIDVSPRYDEGHLPGAVNYYVGDGSLDQAIPNLNKNREYLIYCHVDSASILGAEKLVDAGFTRVYRLEGNYKAWVDAGYPIEK